MIFYVVNDVIYDNYILRNASTHYKNAINTTTVKKHTFLGYLKALAGPYSRGLGRPVLGPSQKVPKIALFRAIITLYTLTCNHYIDIILQLHTIELRVLSGYPYISVPRLLLCAFPRGPQGAALRGLLISCVLFTHYSYCLFIISIHITCVCAISVLYRRS